MEERIVKELYPWKIKELEILSKILKKPFPEENSSFYEYSISKKNKKIKILNLLFYGKSNENQKKTTYEERKNQIKRIFDFFEEKEFDKKTLEKILIQTKEEKFPLQIAFEFYKRKLLKIKLYFSNINQLSENNKETIKLIKKILKILKIPDNIKDREMLGEGIDSIGIDFLTGGETKLKIYTYYKKKFEFKKIKKLIINSFNKYNLSRKKLKLFFKKISKSDYKEFGFLYRISKKGRIDSLKVWYRLKEKINFNKTFFIYYYTCDSKEIGEYIRKDYEFENKDFIFKNVTEKIANTDFTGYTIQYPPLYLWKKQIPIKKLKDWEHIDKKDKVGVYIHIPFCKEKCTFCRYHSTPVEKKEQLKEYLFYLKKEIYMYSKELKNKKIHSVYIGGGTPSILSSKQLKELFKIIDTNFNFIKKAQKCIEINPNGSNYHKLKIMKKFGINRLTIGVQSLNQKVLKGVNRKQTKQQVFKILKKANNLKFKEINIDLMTGLPSETLTSFEKTLKEILKFKPTMVHLHPFYPTKKTLFIGGGGKLSKENYALREIMNERGLKILKEKKYKKIKFDAWGLRVSSRNQQLSDAIEYVSSYIGFGPGATSHIKNKKRYLNFDNFERYKRELDKKRLPIMKSIILSKKDEMIYYITANLRYGEINKKKFKKLFKEDIEPFFGMEIDYLTKRGILNNTPKKIIFLKKSLAEYAIYSKYFYEMSSILKNINKKMLEKNEKEEIYL